MSLLTELCPFVPDGAINMPALTGFEKSVFIGVHPWLKMQLFFVSNKYNRVLRVDNFWTRLVLAEPGALPRAVSQYIDAISQTNDVASQPYDATSQGYDAPS
jgi:hypothetical protein